MKQALFFFVLFFAAMPVFAETVVLKSGRTVEGKILEKTDKYVKIDFEGIALTFYLDEINTIIDQDPKPAKLTKDQKLGITFLVPQEWIRVEEETYPDKGIHTFITSNDPAQRVMLVIRVLRVANQTALQWAIDEVKALEQDKVQIVLQPVEVTFGNTWVTLESKLYTKDASGNTISHKNKQYFTKGEADTMIEVAIMGEESILEKLSSAGRFDAFLSSFDLEEKVKDTNSVQKPLSDEEINRMGNRALSLIIGGKTDEGLELLRQTTFIKPEDPLWHMNYSSMLFPIGQQLFQAGDKKRAEGIFKETEKELLSAIKLFQDKDFISKSHCYFLLGDIYFFVYDDKVKAKELYEKSLEIYPEHNDARKALNNFEASVDKKVIP